MTTVPVSWRKSSFTAQEANCVEVANTLGAMRDSKDRTGPVLVVPLGRFLAELKGGWLDR